MNRFEILTHNGIDGWVEVDDDKSVTYESTGNDPTGGTEDVLSRLESGEIEFYNGPEIDPSDVPLTLSQKLAEIGVTIRTFDPILCGVYDKDYNYLDG